MTRIHEANYGASADKQVQAVGGAIGEPWPADPKVRTLITEDGELIYLRWTQNGLAIEMGQGIGALRDATSPF